MAAFTAGTHAAVSCNGDLCSRNTSAVAAVIAYGAVVTNLNNFRHSEVSCALFQRLPFLSEFIVHGRIPTQTVTIVLPSCSSQLHP